MILIDLNVVLDVVQKREPHYMASAAVLDTVVSGQVAGCLPAHAFTTLHYLIGRYQDRARADRVVTWLLDNFAVAGTNHAKLTRAQQLQWPDFEDAVTMAAAESAACKQLVTRNVRDFREPSLPVVTPEEHLAG